MTREASTEPSVAVTGNLCGSIPAAVSDGPAIIPICRGEGASIHSVRSPARAGRNRDFAAQRPVCFVADPQQQGHRLATRVLDRDDELARFVANPTHCPWA